MNCYNFKMTLSAETSRSNFFAFLWHACFLAFAKNFMDIDTVVPSMLIEAGGGAIHVGLMTAITLGGASFTQLFFAPYLSNKPYKKNFLLAGINTRILSLAGLGAILFSFHGEQKSCLLWLIFIFITLFSLAGAFTNISYIDILGKSMRQNRRKKFFSSNQIISGAMVLAGAFLVKRILLWKDFPINYALMFFLGAGLLLVASAGFWNLRETLSSGMKIDGFKGLCRILKSEIKKNRKLGYFLGYINTQGIAISFLPFVILYAKEEFSTESGDIGNFLLLKVMGMVFASMLVFFWATRIKYNWLLYTNVAISLMAALIVSLAGGVNFLKCVFVVGGITYSLFTITMGGILLEISDNENRALYTGFAGAGNIIPAVFPLLGGPFISLFGFRPFFLFYMGIVSLALVFIFKLDCQK